MSVVEMGIFRWMSGKTREDKIGNEYVRGRISVPYYL
jgi:hypothetical protein